MCVSSSPLLVLIYILILIFIFTSTIDTQNFNIYKGMAPSVSKNTLSFVGHEAGEAVSYRLRVKTNELAEGLKAALDREIAFVTSKAE